MRKVLFFVMLGLLLLPANFAYAQSISDTDQSSVVTPPPTKTYEIPFLPKPDGLPGATTGQLSDPRELRNYFLSTLFPKVTKFLISIVAVGSFAMLLFAGLRYLTALGDTEKGDSAKNTAIYAIVGLVVALLSFVAIQLISSLPLS